MSEKPLSDDDVYDMLHQIRLMLSGRTVETLTGQQIIEMALRDIDLIQQALVRLMDERSNP